MEKLKTIIARSAERKGGMEALESVMPKKVSANDLAKKSDAFFLETMTRGVFQSGFVWRVINKKWPGFLEVFKGFDVDYLCSLPPDVWDSFGRDTRIVRNMQKILATKENAYFVQRISAEYGGFGKFLAQWPEDDLVGLLSFLKVQGSRLGGMTGQYFLRRVGKDAFILSKDVTTALRHAGVDVPDIVTAKRDFKLAQDAFNAWQKESGYGYAQISKYLAYSAGMNHEVEVISGEMKKFGEK